MRGCGGGAGCLRSDGGALRVRVRDRSERPLRCGPASGDERESLGCRVSVVSVVSCACNACSVSTEFAVVCARDELKFIVAMRAIGWNHRRAAMRGPVGAGAAPCFTLLN